ncbi:TIGR02679 family protein [Geobacillus sp. PK12]|uniref:TIGR02679 family protein n=1 Tax=Geobacillus sp. PK12 TaxID=2508525 RepID=UPI0010123BE9|nr:TIGR02679 family protein [Geobacillus sp. PK12]RXS90259.1 TIGR02679 family protein [Geobacillus sp. PK12]
MSTVKEATAFFRSEPGFKRLFAEMKRKYESLGRVGGAVSLQSFSKEERESIAAFFGKDVSRVLLSDFEKQLGQTRFAGVGLVELLEHYFGVPLMSNKERRQAEAEERGRFFARLAEKHHWFEAVCGQRFVQTAYEADRDGLEAAVGLVGAALGYFPLPSYMRLPLFAQQVAGDPHAFDLSTLPGRLLLSALQATVPGDWDMASVESVNELLQSVGLLREDILNFVTCANILAETKDGPHPVFSAAWEANTALNMPLRDVLSLVRARPAHGGTVYIVENAGVFSTLLDTRAPLVSTNGQMNLATMKLLDLLAASGAKLYYSGDFDPEGLAMAERMQERYGPSVTLWRFSVDDYKAANPVVDLTPERLAKLASITSEPLQPLKEAMAETKKAGYQEAIIGRLTEDING